MDKVKKTYKEFFEFMRAAQIALEAYDKSPKFTYALTRVVKANDSFRSEYSELLEDLKIDNAMEQDGKLVSHIENGNEVYDYSKAGKKNLRKQIKDLNETEVEFYCFIASNYPEELDPYTASFLSGFVLKPEVVEEIEQKHLSSTDTPTDSELVSETEGE